MLLESFKTQLLEQNIKTAAGLHDALKRSNCEQYISYEVANEIFKGKGKVVTLLVICEALGLTLQCVKKPREQG